MQASFGSRPSVVSSNAACNAAMNKKQTAVAASSARTMNQIQTCCLRAVFPNDAGLELRHHPSTSVSVHGIDLWSLQVQYVPSKASWKGGVDDTPSA